MVGQDADYKGLQNLESVRRVVVWLYARPLDKSVAAIEEFTDISTKVLLKHEFASGVQLLIAVKVEDEIIEDDEWDPSSNTLVDLLKL